MNLNVNMISGKEKTLTGKDTRGKNFFLMKKEKIHGDFPDGPTAKTLRSQCRGRGMDPWPGNEISYTTTKSSHAEIIASAAKKKKNRYKYPNVHGSTVYSSQDMQVT